jgi:hypothetical protein
LWRRCWWRSEEDPACTDQKNREHLFHGPDISRARA